MAAAVDAKSFGPGKLLPNTVGVVGEGWHWVRGGRGNLLTKACEAQNACIQLHAKIVTSFVFLEVVT